MKLGLLILNSLGLSKNGIKDVEQAPGRKKLGSK
jgi:hypothetical protein